MMNNYRAMLFAIAACALNYLTFAALKVDDANVYSEYYGNKNLNRSKVQRRILSKGKFDVVFLSQPPSYVSTEDRTRKVLQQTFRDRALSKLSSDSSIFETTEGLLLINYVHQFDPGDRGQLEAVFQVVTDAKNQISDEQIVASEEMEKTRTRIDALVDEAGSMAYSHQTSGSQAFQVLYKYFDTLDKRHSLKRTIALQQEKIEALRVQCETTELMQYRILLGSEEKALQTSQSTLSYTESRMMNLDIQLSKHLASAPTDLRQEIFGLLEKYKKDLDTSTDQAIIAEKFEKILAAAQNVDFTEI